MSEGGFPVLQVKRVSKENVERCMREIESIQRIIEAEKLRIGELTGVQCGSCHSVIAWSGHGKRPKLCANCRGRLRREYLKNWRLKNAGHVTEYLRRRRCSLPREERRFRRPKRTLPLDEEQDRRSGAFHYSGE